MAPLQRAAQLTGIPAMENSTHIKTAIECVVDFPDDQLEEDREIVRPGGMGVATAIAELLRQTGATVTEPCLDFEHGWEFVAERYGRRFWVLVTDLEKTKLIQTQDVSSLLKRLFSGRQAYTDFLKLLHRVLAGDARFKSAEWVA